MLVLSLGRRFLLSFLLVAHYLCFDLHSLLLGMVVGTGVFAGEPIFVVDIRALLESAFNEMRETNYVLPLILKPKFRRSTQEKRR